MRDVFSIQGHVSAASIPTLTELAVDSMLQHTLHLLDVKVGRLQPKNQNTHAGCEAVLKPGMVRRVEFEKDGRKDMRAHLEGGIFLYDLDCGRTILLVTKSGHVR